MKAYFAVWCQYELGIELEKALDTLYRLRPGDSVCKREVVLEMSRLRS